MIEAYAPIEPRQALELACGGSVLPGPVHRLAPYASLPEGGEAVEGERRGIAWALAS